LIIGSNRRRLSDNHVNQANFDGLFGRQKLVAFHERFFGEKKPQKYYSQVILNEKKYPTNKFHRLFRVLDVQSIDLAFDFDDLLGVDHNIGRLALEMLNEINRK